MFNKPLVIVVGAGASHDVYGLPLGGTLAEKIAGDTDFMFAHYVNRPTRGDADLFEHVIYRKFHGDRSKLDLYTSAGHKLAAAIGSAVSVDDALYQLSDFPEAVELGKACIMRRILAAEAASDLKIKPDRGEPSPTAGRDGWIEQLFSLAIANHRLADIPNAFKRLTIINFNYDRCIEHYLFWSLRRIGVPTDEAASTVAGLNILRPYGTLGSVLPSSKSFLQFGADANSSVSLDLTSRIRTFTESQSLHDTDQLAASLEAAAMIIFLGFGFHPQNLKLLAMPQQQTWGSARTIATAFKVHEANLPELRTAIAETMWIEPNRIEFHSMTASTVLKELRMKISMAIG
ncbi:hypothetical protein [Bradyrhizobium canariense]|uniref:SIR2-like domain-containing protein n=1 Tax=Bradyrhizobium canariense TaxID=255045 RepID=A0A1X3FRK2_9BRAD|nr:hypothetical protein [Bradyrhizobium canariense]OSI68886.1 hypothetical protein BSZ22_19875 [Bradyrhizobium canariense]OSI79402.1 hypothetical protein BSZ23_15065 [Bradyrhizobium canariense]OSI89600.1 hypothetical protein BSZ25_20335 [Bradyrhizobium canariense]OSI91022.1 hypothetical protein BSZ24_18870 [Bradyrhizobium canariense]OSJ03966.1 hypothetical protein BSZ16_14770 [Bradyrhizobium canariense]